ncbi:peptide-methionine (R)-S-oxide reductase MsrB [Devosia algicola]|uniref:peptide-methionine (R)-S-oxide reductase n=1 Tax=Devosia algicola TaxID=3026418 RepID=A0ABY7YM66_9HYPH|nr:peptide-methionine (R)-S-oxide reductase MsrB [Devosia algicola]WDR02297.1 peptide-methionine (R)-S-oxide reductase MsrB [Devosia algicola]
MKLDRRNFVWSGATLLGLGGLGYLMRGTAPALASDGNYAVTMTDEEWRAKLGDAAYDVLRHEGTERAFTSPLLEEHRVGVFACAGCDLPLYKSDTKFESGTGWPSFYTYIDGALGTKVDNSLFGQRTEVHCSRCGGHQGHVFEDGPQPTGLRYCINGLAIKFIAA